MTAPALVVLAHGSRDHIPNDQLVFDADAVSSFHPAGVNFLFGDGSVHRLGPGGLARVDASTHRSVRNVGNADAILVVAGGKDGYVGRDGQAVGGSGGHGPPGAA